ncbi:BnaAnng24770D, partial [Brassica napus]
SLPSTLTEVTTCSTEFGTNRKKSFRSQELQKSALTSTSWILQANSRSEICYILYQYKTDNTKLPQCVNTTCLPRPPKVTIVDKGVSASVFVDNAAYRTFLRSKFNATAVEMESAAVALISHEQNIPFIVRALSDLAGGGSEISNEADIFGSLAAVNSVDVLVKFVGLLPQYRGSKVQSE